MCACVKLGGTGNPVATATPQLRVGVVPLHPSTVVASVSSSCISAGAAPQLFSTSSAAHADISLSSLPSNSNQPIQAPAGRCLLSFPFSPHLKRPPSPGVSSVGHKSVAPTPPSTFPRPNSKASHHLAPRRSKCTGSASRRRRSSSSKTPPPSSLAEATDRRRRRCG